MNERDYEKLKETHQQILFIEETANRILKVKKIATDLKQVIDKSIKVSEGTQITNVALLYSEDYEDNIFFSKTNEVVENILSKENKAKKIGRFISYILIALITVALSIGQFIGWQRGEKSLFLVIFEFVGVPVLYFSVLWIVRFLIMLLVNYVISKIIWKKSENDIYSGINESKSLILNECENYQQRIVEYEKGYTEIKSAYENLCAEKFIPKKYINSRITTKFISTRNEFETIDQCVKSYKNIEQAGVQEQSLFFTVDEKLINSIKENIKIMQNEEINVLKLKNAILFNNNDDIEDEENIF